MTDDRVGIGSAGGRCPDCHGTMYPVRITERAGELTWERCQPGPAEADTHARWLPDIRPTHGPVRIQLCFGCGRLVLRGEPAPD